MSQDRDFNSNHTILPQAFLNLVFANIVSDIYTLQHSHKETLTQASPTPSTTHVGTMLAYIISLQQTLSYQVSLRSPPVGCSTTGNVSDAGHWSSSGLTITFACPYPLFLNIPKPKKKSPPTAAASDQPSGSHITQSYARLLVIYTL